MKNLMKLYSMTILLLLCSCNEEPPTINFLGSSLETFAKTREKQISGIGFLVDKIQGNYLSQGADFALILTGDLEGCLYVFVENSDCSPNDNYTESGRQLFVGYYKGVYGTFETNYKFSAKFDACPKGDFFLGSEIFRHYQYPIKKANGTGILRGVTGKLNFKSNDKNGSFAYNGYMKF